MGGGDFEKYLSLLRDLTATLEKLTQVEREKKEFVRRDDLMGLNESMKAEQALTLALRSHEQKRQTLVGSLGLEGVSLGDVARCAPAELRQEAKETVETLRREYALFRSAFDAARDLLECNLHQVEAFLRQTDPSRMGPGGGEPELPSQMRTDFRA